MARRTSQLPRDGKGRLVSPPKRNSLPIYLTGGALLVIILGVVLLSNLGRGASGAGSSAQVTGQPKLALDREQINFGKVPLDKAVQATFKLSNVGDQPLQILNQPVVEVKQGC